VESTKVGTPRTRGRCVVVLATADVAGGAKAKIERSKAPRTAWL